MHKEVYGHGKGKVKSIPNAYWGIGKPVPQKVRVRDYSALIDFRLIFCDK